MFIILTVNLTAHLYISGWIAKDHFKIRAINTQLDVPDFATKDGFEDNRLTSFALLLDYFPNSDLTGWWIGGGPVYWAGSIRNSSDKEQADYKTWSATIGTGYVWDISGHFYIMPWAAIIVPVAGDKKFDVENETYEHSGIVPEASVKIGWKF
ncbi:MAG TPA: autotransporter outer membrane beta-barrel domain-containing protein [Nitrospirae bacterium]|nr:autotransporter outer membrane beta-barrel domain-containing protein [Nitrospirota bacterium]